MLFGRGAGDDSVVGGCGARFITFLEFIRATGENHGVVLQSAGNALGRVMNRGLLAAVALVLLAVPAFATGAMDPSDFFRVAGLNARNTLKDAQGAFGLGYIDGTHSKVTFATTGKDGETYRMTFTPGAEIAFDCGWLATVAPDDSLNTLCRAPNADGVHALLARGKDRNAFLRLLGAKMKGVQVDYGGALVTVGMDDPLQPPQSVMIAWCSAQGQCVN
jgi:hypothetical protein